MQKQLKTLFFIVGLLCTTVHAETIQLGGDSAVRTAGWLELAGESGVNNAQPISYTDTNGITFTVTATANAGAMVNVLNIGLGVVGGLNDLRIDSAESLELTLSVSGGNLSSLSASFLIESLNSGDGEGFDVTDGTSTVVIAQLTDSLVEYGAGNELDGLAPLTENNLSTWSILFTPNAAYPDTKGLLGALILDYTVATATYPPPRYPLYAEADQLYSNTNTYDLAQETYSFSTLWSTPVQDNINFLPQSYNSPIVTRGDDTFVLFVDPDHRMKVAHLTNGVFKGESFIDNTLYQPDEFYANHDANPDNDVIAPDYHRFKFEDSHHSVALGIDEYGYLHMVGDMHNYPRYEGSMSHLPLRYFDKNIMYWRSDNPLDISSFSFKGDQAGECPAGSGFTYLFFFNDLYGKLHITSRAQQTWNNGTRCATYSSYNADNGQWTIIGGAPDPSDPNSIPCTFYDDGYEHNEDGSSSGKYSKLRPHGVFDRDNNMHLVTPMLRDPTLNPIGLGNGFHFTDSLVYAQSKDGGQTFSSAGGTEFDLPATVNQAPNYAELVYGQPGDYLSPNADLAVDYMDRPFTSTQKKDLDTGISESVVLGWDGSEWINYGDLSAAGGDFRLVNDPAGVISYFSDSASILYRFWNPTNLYEVTLPWAIRVIDYEYQKKTGNLMGLAKIGGEMAVVKMEINNRPGLGLIEPPAETVTNQPPEITAPAAINGYALSVSASDADGDPLTYTWSLFYGSNAVSFASNGTTASSNTTISVPVEGTYEIKVAVSDGKETRFSTCSAFLTVSATDSPNIVNEAAASPDTIVIGETSILTVTATNTATGGAAVYSWNKVSGPGNVSFSMNSTTDSSNTVASFDAIGTYELQVTASNSYGSATSSCTVDVTGAPPVSANGYVAIDFSSQAFESFVKADDYSDRTGTVEVVESGAGVRFTGDLWKAFPVNYQMTSSTVIEFDFYCPNGGELHAIAMTDTTGRDFVTDHYEIIKLDGTDGGLYITDRDGEYSGGTNRYSIAIGQLLSLNTELKNYLDFVNADNRFETNPDAQSTFANVIIYEPSGDNDGDGQSNLAEVRLGSDPTDAASMFSINGEAILPDLGKVRISWPSQADIQYRVSTSPDLTAWNVVRGWAVAQTPPEDVFEVDLTPSNGFFKVEAQIQ